MRQPGQAREEENKKTQEPPFFRLIRRQFFGALRKAKTSQLWVTILKSFHGWDSYHNALQWGLKVLQLAKYSATLWKASNRRSKQLFCFQGNGLSPWSTCEWQRDFPDPCHFFARLFSAAPRLSLLPTAGEDSDPWWQAAPPSHFGTFLALSGKPLLYPSLPPRTPIKSFIIHPGGISAPMSSS